jgi:hypothetical protein
MSVRIGTFRDFRMWYLLYCKRGKDVLCLTKQYAMKAYGRVGKEIHIFLTGAVVGSERSASHPGALIPGAPGTHWIGGWVGPTAGLDDMEKGQFLTLSGLELYQSPYRLRYRDPILYTVNYLIN